MGAFARRRHGDGQGRDHRDEIRHPSDQWAGREGARSWSPVETVEVAGVRTNGASVRLCGPVYRRFYRTERNSRHPIPPDVAYRSRMCARRRRAVDIAPRRSPVRVRLAPYPPSHRFATRLRRVALAFLLGAWRTVLRRPCAVPLATPSLPSDHRRGGLSPLVRLPIGRPARYEGAAGAGAQAEATSPGTRARRTDSAGLRRANERTPSRRKLSLRSAVARHAHPVR